MGFVAWLVGMEAIQSTAIDHIGFDCAESSVCAGPQDAR